MNIHLQQNESTLVLLLSSLIYKTLTNDQKSPIKETFKYDKTS